MDSSDSNKLDLIIALLLGVTPTALPAQTVSDDAPAYDRPELTKEQVQFFDGKTFNSDGSLWIRSQGDPRIPSLVAGTPIRMSYGYISPVKTPIIWEMGKKWSQNWDNVDAEWRRAPYRIFRADIPAWLKSNGEANNFIMLGYLMNSDVTFVQK